MTFSLEGGAKGSSYRLGSIPRPTNTKYNIIYRRKERIILSIFEDKAKADLEQ